MPPGAVTTRGFSVRPRILRNSEGWTRTTTPDALIACAIAAAAAAAAPPAAMDHTPVEIVSATAGYLAWHLGQPLPQQPRHRTMALQTQRPHIRKVAFAATFRDGNN